MLRFRVQMTFAPQALGEAVQALRSLVGPVRAEPGCSATQLSRDVYDENTMAYVEEWRSSEDFERHLPAANFRRVMAVMDLADVAPIVEIETVSSRRGFDLVEEILGRIGNLEVGHEVVKA